MLSIGRKLALALLGGTACLLAANFSTAQTFPTRPVRLIVPVSPGAASDVLARIISPELSKHLGQPVVVENKPGADSLIGAEYVAKQVPADGYTIYIAINGTLASFPVLTKDLRFDPLKDLPPFVGLAEGRFTLVTASKHSWRTFGELAANAKANPDKLNYGVGTSLGRLLVETVVQDQQLKIEHIRYPVIASYVQALITGDVQFGLVSEQLAISMGDKVRLLVVTGERRSLRFPDTPTFKELGYPQIKGLSFTLNLPVGVPAATVERLRVAASRALQQPEVKERLAGVMLEVLDETSDVAARKLAEEGKLYSEVAKKIGLQPQ